MKTIRVKTLVLFVFVLTLGAGVVAGLLAARLPGSGTPVHTTAVDSPLGEELGLTADQRDKMKSTWENVRGLTDDCLREARKAENIRDEKIFALIPPDKRDQYNAIKSEYDNAVAALQGKREKAFADAVRDSREKILSPAQREKYDKILKSRLGAEFGVAHDATQPGLQP